MGLRRAGEEGEGVAQREGGRRDDGREERTLDGEAAAAEGEQEALDDHRGVRGRDCVNHEHPLWRRLVRLRPVQHGLHVRGLRTPPDRRRGVPQEGGGQPIHPHTPHERRR